MTEPQAIFGDDGNATKTGFATCYSFNPDTGEYLGSFEFWTLIGSGIAGSSTRLEPPKAADNQVAVFKNGAWSLIPDHRGETVYSTKDQSISVVKLPGDYAADTTPIKPATQYDKWDGQKWATDADAQHKGDVSAAGKKKSMLLDEVSRTISFWQTELQLGIISDPDKASLITWLKYAQLVQSVDTSNLPVTFPPKPS